MLDQVGRTGARQRFRHRFGCRAAEALDVTIMRVSPGSPSIADSARICSGGLYVVLFGDRRDQRGHRPRDVVTNAIRAATARTAGSSCLTASISRFCTAGSMTCSTSNPPILVSSAAPAAPASLGAAAAPAGRGAPGPAKAARQRPREGAPVENSRSGHAFRKVSLNSLAKLISPPLSSQFDARGRPLSEAPSGRVIASRAARGAPGVTLASGAIGVHPRFDIDDRSHPQRADVRGRPDRHPAARGGAALQLPHRRSALAHHRRRRLARRGRLDAQRAQPRAVRRVAARRVEPDVRRAGLHGARVRRPSRPSASAPGRRALVSQVRGMLAVLLLGLGVAPRGRTPRRAGRRAGSPPTTSPSCTTARRSWKRRWRRSSSSAGTASRARSASRCGAWSRAPRRCSPTSPRRPPSFSSARSALALPVVARPRGWQAIAEIVRDARERRALDARGADDRGARRARRLRHPVWQDYRFYNWQMSVTRKPSYDLRSILDRVTWFPVLHDVFTRMWLVTALGLIALAVSLARCAVSRRPNVCSRSGSARRPRAAAARRRQRTPVRLPHPRARRLGGAHPRARPDAGARAGCPLAAAAAARGAAGRLCVLHPGRILRAARLALRGAPVGADRRRVRSPAS